MPRPFYTKHRFRKRRRYRRTPLASDAILAWADAFRARWGRWPYCKDPRRVGMPGEIWTNIDQALRKGLRGLPGGSSIAQLLAEHRGARNPKDLPPLPVSTILRWCDAHYRKHGKWPTALSGPIAAAPGETWNAVDTALLLGQRDLPGGSSLARLLASARGKRNLAVLPSLTVRQILCWADAYHGRTGRWPTERSGEVAEAPGETWCGLNYTLQEGRRGLPAGFSLARLLAHYRGARNAANLPQLSLAGILGWADAHRRRTGQWPTRRSGSIRESPGETWQAVHMALRQGSRGLPGGSSLPQLLAERRGAREPVRPRLHVEQVIAWAEAHYARTGGWPGQKTGAVGGAPAETWRGLDQALRQGLRGLPAGGSLARLLAERRGVANPADRPRLTEQQILGWAGRHRQRTGCWPTADSGEVVDAAGERWRNLEAALQQGYRGLPGGSSLARLLADRHGVGPRTGRKLAPLQLGQVRRWAAAYRRRTGRWPTADSGPIGEAPRETWKGVDRALREGGRGLPGGSSLHRLLS